MQYSIFTGFDYDNHEKKFVNFWIEFFNSGPVCICCRQFTLHPLEKSRLMTSYTKGQLISE